MSDRVSPGELNQLYKKLSPEERDELLQCLLIAAPRGGEAMIKVLEDELLYHATDELFEKLCASRKPASDWGGPDAGDTDIPRDER